jgi:IS30 family transposase
MPQPNQYSVNTPVLREAVGRLTRGGHSSRQIADRLGISQRSVVRNRAALGISAPVRRITAEEHARIIAMLEDEVPLAEIARTLSRHPDSLYRRYGSMAKRGSNMQDCVGLRRQLGLLP